MKRKTVRPIRVWVGFIDGKPFVDKDCEGWGQAGYCVYRTRKAALGMFDDVRPMVLAGYRAAKREKGK